MVNDRKSNYVYWPDLALMLGGLLMAPLWLIYTTVHGPTSFDRTGVVLGQSTLFWGSLLGGIPNLLISLGWIGRYPFLARQSGRLAQIGYALTLFGLIVPAVIDLLTVGLGPPIFIPFLGVGLVLTAVGNRKSPDLHRRSQIALLLMGLLLLGAFTFTVMIPDTLSDQIGAYRIYGFQAHFLAGTGWILLGYFLKNNE
jgi:hypothetical protein